MSTEERWAEIERFAGYVFSTAGGFRSAWTLGRGACIGDRWRELRGSRQSARRGSQQYRIVALRVDLDHSEQHQLGALILEAFVGPPGPDQECRYLDGDGTNCDLSNLEWATRGEIARARFRPLTLESPYGSS